MILATLAYLIWLSNFEIQVTLAAGLGLIVYAGFAGEDNWREFYQYLRESKFVSAMMSSISFQLQNIGWTSITCSVV